MYFLSRLFVALAFIAEMALAQPLLSRSQSGHPTGSWTGLTQVEPFTRLKKMPSLISRSSRA